MATWIDHLMLASPSLEEGIEHVRALTGTAPVFGGAHEGAGTHNALMSLGATTYLEVIAPDPAQAIAPTMFDGEISACRLLGFAVGCDDIDATVAHLRAVGVGDVGDRFDMSRRRPDGSLLAWRLAFVGAPAGPRPFLISWVGATSPAEISPVGGQFVSLRGGESDPADTVRLLDALGLDVDVEVADGPWLAATVDTPGGRVTLR